MATKHKNKEPIRLREKKLANGNVSLYLDTYINGKREYEFLKLYLIPERSSQDKKQNEETLRTAKAVKAQRIVELQNSKHGFANARTRSKVKLFDYLKNQRQQYAASGSVSYSKKIQALIFHLNNSGLPNIAIGDIDKDYLYSFISALKTATIQKGKKPTKPQRYPIKKKEPQQLAQTTIALNFKMLKSMLNNAVKDGIITDNIALKMPGKDVPRPDYKPRCYLTLEEVRTLANTPVPETLSIDVPQAFLFSCFTGLRLSDIQALKWENIQKTTGDGLQIELKQQKTKERVIIPLSQNAIRYLPKLENPAPKDRLYKFTSNAQTSNILKRWTQAAGIDKHVTFHVARHTFATLELSFGADLYTVSKLLGHSNINTTQIYAKIIDENKRKAVDLIPDL
jgi:integrase